MMSHVANEREIDVILISEPNKKAAENLLFDDGMNTAIKVNGESYESSITRSGQRKHIVWIETLKYIICSVYISPNAAEEEAEEVMKDILDIKRRTSKEIIVGGDFNAKSNTWDAAKTDKRGDMVEEYMASGGLVACNIQYSHIDITMVEENSLQKVRQWQILDTESLSDHRYIELKLEETMQTIQLNKINTNKRWRINDEGLQRLAENLNKCIPEGREQIELPEDLTKAIQKSCDMTFKRIKTNNRFREKYWWNQDIARIRKETNAIRRKLTRENRKSHMENGKNKNVTIEDTKELYKNKKNQLRK